MSIHKLFGFLVFIGACLLAGCGGGGSDAPVATVRDGYVYMAGGYVEGLTYITETQSGTTGPKGQFKYQAGETVTFKVGSQSLPLYKIMGTGILRLTHFDILKDRNPNATFTQNLSVLLHLLDEDGNISNGIKISSDKLLVSDRVSDGLQTTTYLSALETELSKAQMTMPDLGAVLSRSTAQMNTDGVNIAPYAFGSASFNEFNSIITLSAVGSADANADPLTYRWTIDSRPKSSAAVIVNPTSREPTLVVDAFDEPYIFRLTVTDSAGNNSVTQVIANVARTTSPSVKEGYVYMAGGYVEGLTYATETQSGTTGPRGQFKYQAGETVTFKVGNQALPPYKISLIAPLPLTHFDILNDLNPNGTFIQNLSVLLHMLDEDGNISNGIRLSSGRTTVANRVSDGLQTQTYLSALGSEASKAQLTLPSLSAVLSRTTTQMKSDGVNIAPYAFASASFNESNSIINLSAVGSADANSDTLTYRWTIDSRPKSSNAVIVNPTSREPTLLVDAFDEPYIFRLTVTDSGGNSSVTQVTVTLIRTGFVYMAGGYVEGLTYTTETQSGTTGPRGQFKYQAGETVTFKVGNQALPSFKIMGTVALPLTLFDILNDRNPNATFVQNLSVLMQLLDEDGNISNGIKLSSNKLLVSNRVSDGLQAQTYLSALAAEASKAQMVLPKLGEVLAASTAKMNSDKVFIAPYAFGSASFNEFNSVINLSSAGTADANSDPLTYNWTIASKPKSSNAVILSPTSREPTLVADAFDEPYIFRLTVTDSGGLSAVTQVTANVTRNPIAGVYTQKLDANTRQLVVISDTSEILGYALSNSANRSRRFSGPITRSSVNSPQYAAAPLTYLTTQPCSAPCADRIDVTANFLAPRSITITNNWANSFLFESAAPAQLAAVGLSDQALQIANLEGTYREKDSAPDSKDWKITDKGEFNFYKTLDGKSTLCAIGQIRLDKLGQVLNRQGFVTRHIVPVSIEFKNECDESFDSGTFSTGYLVPDPLLGNAGYSFIGYNEARTRYFLRHFIKQ